MEVLKANGCSQASIMLDGVEFGFDLLCPTSPVRAFNIREPVVCTSKSLCLTADLPAFFYISY